MLYFSKTKVFCVILISLIFIFFSISNFIDSQKNIFSKKINLGLDLQGGSYLLLEIDEKPVVIKTLQNKVIQIKNIFKEKKIVIKNINIKENNITFSSLGSDVDNITKELTDQESILNPYYQKYKAFQF